MKIVNISLCAPYNDGWGYQENLLTKWQYKIGNEVTLLTTRFISRKGDDGYDIVKQETFINKDNVKVIRLDWLFNFWVIRILRLYKNLYSTLENEKPDFIFIHGCQFLDSLTVCRYLKKHSDVKAVVDNHADFTNSAKTFFPKLLHYTLWRFTANKLSHRIEKFYGVLPVRCEFLNRVYGIPNNKIDLLLMGVDDDVILDSNKSKFSGTIEKYNNQINVVCGGKFDNYKKEVLNLMDAVNAIDNINLYIFGSIGDEIKGQFDNKISDKIHYLGWLNQSDSYSIISQCDIAVFPGRHSVIWEQCAGIGVPLIVRRWPKTDHVNINNNCLYLENGSEEEIEQVLSSLLKDRQLLFEIKENACSIAKNAFSYREISKRSIEVKTTSDFRDYKI